MRPSATAHALDISLAAEARRRELPVSIALVILIGGLAAAILGGGAPIFWAALVGATLVADNEFYRRAEETGALGAKGAALLAAWAAISGALFAALPVALWLDGQAAGAAAAMLLWVVGALRPFGAGFSGALHIALAGAAPCATSLLIAPSLAAALSARPDWDLAVIATLGGGALLGYGLQARWRAHDAEAREGAAEAGDRHQIALAMQMLIADETPAALIDRDGRLRAMSRALRDTHAAAQAGDFFETVLSGSPQTWREAFARALRGEDVSFGGDGSAAWRLCPWRDASDVIVGVFARQPRRDEAGAHAADVKRLLAEREILQAELHKALSTRAEAPDVAIPVARRA